MQNLEGLSLGRARGKAQAKLFAGEANARQRKGGKNWINEEVVYGHHRQRE